MLRAKKKQKSKYVAFGDGPTEVKKNGFVIQKLESQVILVYTCMYAHTSTYTAYGGGSTGRKTHRQTHAHANTHTHREQGVLSIAKTHVQHSTHTHIHRDKICYSVVQI